MILRPEWATFFKKGYTVIASPTLDSDLNPRHWFCDKK
jgi:hypothetical protein